MLDFWAADFKVLKENRVPGRIKYVDLLQMSEEWSMTRCKVNTGVVAQRFPFSNFDFLKNFKALEKLKE